MKKLFIRSQSEEMTLKELFEEFLIAKQCVNVSPFTIRFYEGCYRHFTDYVDEETPCSEITLHTVFGADLQNGFDAHNPLDVIAQKTQRNEYIQMKK